MSLRSRLLLATLLLVTAGLLVADVATYRFLSSFLTRRVDQQLAAATVPAIRALSLAGRFGPGEVRVEGGREGPFPVGTYAAVLDGDGGLRAEYVFTFDEEAPPPPDLPEGLPGSSSAEVGVRSALLTVGGGGATRYRVLAHALLRGGTLVVAIPLTEVRDTLNRLVLIEVAVTLGVLVAVGALALWLVRLGLRPLERMGETAGAIAAGDLSRRVEPADRRTEVGRLGLALNAMLTQIEGAFAERRASEERLRRFVADASHELRTPLTSIRGYAELFRHGASDRPEDLTRAMAGIEGESTRMGELVDELLLLARLDQGRPLERERVDLAAVTSAAVDAARAAQPARPIDLDVRGPVMVLGDAARLRQVADNLLANAQDHTPEDTPVHVRVRPADGEALMEVADDGPGIPPGDAERIFERFYRADTSRSREGGGVGLGLSIVTAVARAHGGSAGYEPAPGGGALFRVALPLVDVAPGGGAGEEAHPQR